MGQQIYLSDKKELQQLIKEAVKEVFDAYLPMAIRKASRKKWLTTNELMKELNCSRRHLQYLRTTNQIPFIQNGKKVWYDMDDIEEFFTHYKIR